MPEQQLNTGAGMCCSMLGDHINVGLPRRVLYLALTHSLPPYSGRLVHEPGSKVNFPLGQINIKYSFLSWTFMVVLTPGEYLLCFLNSRLTSYLPASVMSSGDKLLSLMLEVCLYRLAKNFTVQKYVHCVSQCAHCVSFVVRNSPRQRFW